MDPARKNIDDSGFSEDTRQSSEVTGNVCIDVKGHWTLTGACGPYNLGGSTTEWYQSPLQRLL